LPTNDLIEPTMNADAWTFKFAHQLHQQWPRVDHADLEHLAGALLTEERWSCMEPTEAATQWLRQGIPETSRVRS
jgi:hypothetical protein